MSEADIRSQLDLFRKVLFVPRPDVAHAALALSKIATSDLATAKILHREKMYPQAVYFLQQSVEKSAKALGLMLGTIKLNQMREVSHMSVFALLQRTGTLARNLKRSVDTLGEINRKGGEAVRILNLGNLLNRMAPMVPTEAALTRDRENMRRLDPRRMWLATLNLDRGVPEVAEALQNLEAIYWDKPDVRMPLDIMGLLFKTLGSDDQPLVDFALSGVRSTPRALSLTMLTMWHEAATRYPPGSSRFDYWDADAYTADKEMVKQFPMLARHAKVFSDGVRKKSVAAMKIGDSKTPKVQKNRSITSIDGMRFNRVSQAP